MRMPNIKKRNLVVAPVGDKSCHKQWLKGAERNFDLMLIYYGTAQDKYKEDAEYYFHIQGLFKLETIAAAINKSIDIAKKYETICLPDDDISMNARAINNLFRIFHKYDLDLAQPAVREGKISHSNTLQNKYCKLRYVNFIEMMCPIFKTDILLANMHTFTLSRSGWGIDFLWSKNLKDKKLAIIDSIGISHGRNQPREAIEYYKRLAALGINSFRELDIICNRYDCEFRGKMVEYRRISKPAVTRILVFCKSLLKKTYDSIKLKGVLGTIRKIYIIALNRLKH